jgi:hypothetical protein
MSRDNDAPSFRREKPWDMSNENIVVARRQADGTLAQALPDGSRPRTVQKRVNFSLPIPRGKSGRGAE